MNSTHEDADNEERALPSPGTRPEDLRLLLPQELESVKKLVKLRMLLCPPGEDGLFLWTGMGVSSSSEKDFAGLGVSGLGALSSCETISGREMRSSRMTLRSIGTKGRSQWRSDTPVH